MLEALGCVPALKKTRHNKNNRIPVSHIMLALSVSPLFGRREVL
jgi:hypothetical protein